MRGVLHKTFPRDLTQRRKNLSRVPSQSSAVQSPRPACRAARRGSMKDRASSTSASVAPRRSEEHTSELQSLMRISYAVFCLKKKNSEMQSKQQNLTTNIRKTMQLQ